MCLCLCLLVALKQKRKIRLLHVRMDTMYAVHVYIIVRTYIRMYTYVHNVVRIFEKDMAGAIYSPHAYV